MVSHQSNTNPGFSGTLFRAIKDNEELGIKAGELVMSFRSAEFVDDNVRDSKATNEPQIQPAVRWRQRDIHASAA